MFEVIILKLRIQSLFAIYKYESKNLTDKQLHELDSLFELVSQRQTKDFGNISASNKADGSLLTSCDLWSDKTIVDGLAQ